MLSIWELGRGGCTLVEHKGSGLDDLGAPGRVLGENVLDQSKLDLFGAGVVFRV